MSRGGVSHLLILASGLAGAVAITTDGQPWGSPPVNGEWQRAEIPAQGVYDANAAAFNNGDAYMQEASSNPVYNAAAFQVNPQGGIVTSQMSELDDLDRPTIIRSEVPAALDAGPGGQAPRQPYSSAPARGAYGSAPAYGAQQTYGARQTQPPAVQAPGTYGANPYGAAPANPYGRATAPYQQSPSASVRALMAGACVVPVWTKGKDDYICQEGSETKLKIEYDGKEDKLIKNKGTCTVVCPKWWMESTPATLTCKKSEWEGDNGGGDKVQCVFSKRYGAATLLFVLVVFGAIYYYRQKQNAAKHDMAYFHDDHHAHAHAPAPHDGADHHDEQAQQPH